MAGAAARGGGTSETCAWLRIATAKNVLQGGIDETKIVRLSRLDLWLAVEDEGAAREVFNTGTCKVYIDGTSEGLFKCVKTMFKRGQFITTRLRGVLAEAGHNPDDLIPLAGGGCLLHKLRAVMHDTCNAAYAAARAVITANARAVEAHFET